MSDSPPCVYILNGDDEFAMAQFVSELEARLGDPGQVAMDMVRLDGRVFNPDELYSIAGALPFLARRRLVILDHPLARLQTQEARQRFQANLEKIPPSTALILIEYKVLTEEKQRQQGNLHWLEKWAQAHRERALVRIFTTPKDLSGWVAQRTRELGGQIAPDAAHLLANLVDHHPRMADQEISKLMAYVNYQRMIESADVHAVTADLAEGNIFALVDALGQQNARQAMAMLSRLLESQDPQNIFAMIVRQFRLLLLAREILDDGIPAQEIARKLKQHPFVAGKIAAQAQRFSFVELKSIYQKLLDIDHSVKTGRLPDDLALEMLVATLGGVGAVHSDPEMVG